MKKFYSILFLLLFFGLEQSNAQFNFACTRDTTIVDCSISCITLKAVIPDMHAPSATTTTYAVTQLTGAGIPNSCFKNPVDPGAPGISGNVSRDDEYTNIINLPFTFPFYGTNYNSLVLSTNGYISFDKKKLLRNLLIYYKDLKIL